MTSYAIPDRANLPLEAKQRQLDVLAALLTERMGYDQISLAQWLDFIPLAIEQGMGAYLYQVAKRNGAVDESQPIWRILANHSREAQIRLLGYQAAMVHIQKRLSADNIAVLWLKGVPLAYDLYQPPHTRWIRDLDMVVHYDDRFRALAALEALGYYSEGVDMRLNPFRRYYLDALTHHYGLFKFSTFLQSVELHYDLLGSEWREVLKREDYDWFWAQTQTVTMRAALRVLKPEALALYLMAHDILRHGSIDLVQHGRLLVRLQRKYDLHLLVKQHSLDWDTIIKRARDLDWLYALRQTLVDLRHYFDTPIPSEVWRVVEPMDNPFPPYLLAAASRNRWQQWRAMRPTARLAYLGGVMWRFFANRDRWRLGRSDTPLHLI